MSEKDFYQVSLKLILKNDQGEILGLKALDNDSFAGFYDLPGGRIDTNEFNRDLVDIIKRELIEEIGAVKVTIINKPVALGRHESKNLNHKGEHIHVVYILFEASYQSGDIVISKEHLGYKWLDLKNIKLEDYFTSGVLQAMKMYLNYEKS